MAITLADQYYLKALDGYSYDIEVSIENLNYALSYDPDHVGANCLMGQLYIEYFKDYDKAEACFQTALSSDPRHITTGKEYCYLLIRLRKFDMALKLVMHLYQIPGVDLAMAMHLEALIHEYRKDFSKAKKLLSDAMGEAYNSESMYFLKGEIRRVEVKEKAGNKYNVDIID